MSGTKTRGHSRITGRTDARTSARVRRHLRVRKTDKAKQVGALLAERATAAGITAAVFDRGGHAYHGRMAALADSAREGGLAL